MSRRVALDINRVEGDLRVELDVENGRVKSARCIGTMYRGFEQILLGRDPLDALAITPRICGICSTTHLYAAVTAIEDASGIVPAPAAVRVRNLCLMSETIQSDLRHAVIFAAADFCDPHWAGLDEAGAAQATFAPFTGSAVRETVDYTGRLLKIVGHFGGQWPHSSFMVPGGVTLADCGRQLQASQAIYREVLGWFERSVLGDTLENFLALDTALAFERWRDDPARHGAWLPLYDRLMLAAGLDAVGHSHSLLLTYGTLPSSTSVAGKPVAPVNRMPAGCFDLHTRRQSPSDMEAIAEDVSHAWFHDPDGSARRPAQGITQPAWTQGGQAYSWAKAPRYQGQPAQTGPLALLACAGEPLVLDMLAHGGDSARVRAFSRLRRTALLLREMSVEFSGLLDEFRAKGAPVLMRHGTLASEGVGVGLVDAARGALGHWLRIANGRIDGYQVITPTSWHASPRDKDGVCGPIERALEGLPWSEGARPMLVEQVIRSFDPCLVCTVH